jgi:RimJ/RimL family protein N-acetyltransferase
MTGTLERDRWHPPQLRGQQVLLRHHRASDLAAIVRWYRDPELARLTRYQSQPMSEEEVERFFRGRLLADDALAYAIEHLPAGRLVGFTTFSALDPENLSVLFHITIGERDAWGRGLGTEATQLMLQHAFERLGLHRVGLAVFSYNTRAIRAYEKAGFRVEGRLREAIARQGEYFDEVQMGILAGEWFAAQYGHARAPDDEMVASR